MSVFYEDITQIIISYHQENELLDWVNQERINWFNLSQNPAAIDLIMSNPRHINWAELSGNPAIFKPNVAKCKAVTKILMSL